MADPATLQAWLTAAEIALNDLMTGGKPVSVSSSSGKSVTYSAAQIPALQAYIASLRRQLGLSSMRPFSFQVGGH
jgi:hypothetical protein